MAEQPRPKPGVESPGTTTAESSGISDILEIAAGLEPMDVNDNTPAPGLDYDDLDGGFGATAATTLVPNPGAPAPVAAHTSPATRRTPTKLATREFEASSPAGTAAAHGDVAPPRAHAGRWLSSIAIVAGVGILGGLAWIAKDSSEPSPEHGIVATAPEPASVAPPRIEVPTPSPAISGVSDTLNPDPNADPDDEANAELEALGDAEAAPEPTKDRATASSKPRATAKRDATESDPKPAKSLPSVGANDDRAADSQTEPIERPTEAATDSEVSPPEAAKPAESESVANKSAYTAECLLDPSRPGCQDPNASKDSKPDNGPNVTGTLPDKLSDLQLRQALAGAKETAKACGTQHGAPAGTQVRVKLSIAGDTGKVVSAQPLDSHATTALGRCVADALKSATFPRFASPLQGTVYPVRL